MVGILLLAANLRPALTALAPLIGEVRAQTGISNGAAGLLTALPLVAFGVLSPVAPRLSKGRTAPDRRAREGTVTGLPFPAVSG